MDDRSASGLPFAIDKDGLRDFWAVYDRRFEDVQRVALAFAYDHPDLGPIVRSMSDAQMAAQNERSRTMLRDAIASGDWSAYVADIRQQGTHYARLGLSFSSWYSVVRVAHEVLVPALVESYGKTPARLARALTSMVGFFDGAMSVLAEQYLDAKETDRARLLVASLKDCVLIMLDPQGNVASWNLGAKDLIGYEPDEIIGKPFSLLYPSDERERDGPTRELEVAASQGRFECDGWRVRKDGSRFWANVVVTPIRDMSGRSLGYAKIMRDLSERRKGELELRAAKEAAETANRELEAFSYSVAHDLRAPLRAMNGFANILVEDYQAKLDDDGRDALAEIQGNAVRMGALIDGLLLLARVARTELARADVDLTGLARTIAAQLAIASPGRAVDVVVQPGLVARADPSLTRTLLQNLLENAWKFTGKTPVARIEVGAVADAGERAFFVRDNGAGFDPAYVSKLFAPFQRLHSLSEFAGTGIGLATVQRVVRRHGGRVWAEGAIGAGATFHFTLAPPGQRGLA